MLIRIRRIFRKTRRRTVIAVITGLLACSLGLGWFVGINPETRELEIGFNPEYSLTGRTLNFAATNIGLPQIIGDSSDSPTELAFEDQDTQTPDSTRNTTARQPTAEVTIQQARSSNSTDTTSTSNTTVAPTATTTGTSRTVTPRSSSSSPQTSTNTNSPTTASNNAPTITRPPSSLPYVLPSETGVLQPISSLQSVSANFGDYYKVTTDGQVLEGLNIDACLLIEADNVIVRNSQIRCNAQRKTIINIGRGFTGTEVTQNTLICVTRDCPEGIAGTDFEASYNDISDVVAGIESRGDNVAATRNYIHDVQNGIFPIALRGAGGSGLIFDGNYIQGSAALGHAIFIQPELHLNTPSPDALVTNNYITGNSMWQPISCQQHQNLMNGCTVNRNFIDSTQNFSLIFLDTDGSNSANGNVYLDGKTPIPSSRILIIN